MSKKKKHECCNCCQYRCGSKCSKYQEAVSINDWCSGWKKGAERCVNNNSVNR